MFSQNFMNVGMSFAASMPTATSIATCLKPAEIDSSLIFPPPSHSFASWFVTARGNTIPLEKEQGYMHSGAFSMRVTMFPLAFES